MTIIVFLVDTSASMQQNTFVAGRNTLLNMAKNAVEMFVKSRQKSPESRGDRYMLFSFEEYPKNIKAGWKENLPTFNNELKNLEANGMTTFGYALRQVFDTLNVNRLQNGMDMYGQGRYPYYLEPAVIITITDGGKLATHNGIEHELSLPASSLGPGSELTKEPFRWDQRLYALVLRMAGTPPMYHEGGHVASDCSQIDSMCEITGGRSYAVTSQRILYQCIDSLVQKLQAGVVVHFEKFGADPTLMPSHKENGNKSEDGLSLSRADTSDTVLLDDVFFSSKGQIINKDANIEGNVNGGNIQSRPPTPNPILASHNVAWYYTKKLLFVQRSAQKGFAVGYWPLPESYWPDAAAPTLPQRSTHPIIKFTCIDQDPMMIENLPFDKYELEPSPLTLYILARKQPKTCWQVYVQGSSNPAITYGTKVNIGCPFGYIKASSNLLTVNLYVLPYNYPILLPLLNELFKTYRLKPPADWKTSFQAYLRTIPAYYIVPLKRALIKMGAATLVNNLMPEALDTCMSYIVSTYLKKLKNQAKIEYDKILNISPAARCRKGPDGIQIVARSVFKKKLVTNHLLKDKFTNLEDQLIDFSAFRLGIKDSIGNRNIAKSTNNQFRNPFDIPRRNILDQIVRMRANFLQPCANQTKLIDDDSRHNLPIGQMGNYQDHLKKMPIPLREIESTPVRQHMFGNPFKTSKNMIMGEVDEVSLSAPGSNMSHNRGQKRQNESASNSGIKRGRKGPLSKEFVYYRARIKEPVNYLQPQTTVIENLLKLKEQKDILDPGFMDDQLEIQRAPLCSPQSSFSNGILTENRLIVNGNSETNVPITESVSDAIATATIENQPNFLTTTEKLTNPNQESMMNQGASGQSNSISISDPLLITSSNDNVTYNKDISTLKSYFPKSTSPKILIGNSEHRNSGATCGLMNTSSEYSNLLSQKTIENGGNTPCNYSKDDLRGIHQRNLNMRQMMYKEVKRPGKNHERLIKMLKEQIHGPPHIRRLYIKDVINEALRFKRIGLAELLEKSIEDIIPK